MLEEDLGGVCLEEENSQSQSHYCHSRLFNHHEMDERERPYISGRASDVIENGLRRHKRSGANCFAFLYNNVFTWETRC